MDRITDNKRIEAWKKLEDESKEIDVPILVNLEQIISEDTNIVPLAEGSWLYSRVIAKSGTYLNSNGDPELIFVYMTENVKNNTSYVGYMPTSRGMGPCLVGTGKFCLGYARKTINNQSVFYELISKSDNPEKIKRLHEVIKLLDEDVVLKQYLSQYSELIIETFHEHINLLLKGHELKSKQNVNQVVDGIYKLIAELKETEKP